ncbi:DNA helicase, partial [Paraburkholderia hospita]
MARLIRPTPEQQAIVDAVAGGGNLKIKAYAGAGKTSTLRLVANRLAHQRGIYLAFNREIAEHARRGFPPNVMAGTVHSLAYRSVSPALAARVNHPAELPHELAARYGIGPVEVPLVTGKTVELTPFE